jgi:ADP-heptose:LPS heptosyltransferase
MKPTLLIFEQRTMGDAIMSLPFVRSALEGYDVFVACTPASVAVFELILPDDHILAWAPPWLEEDSSFETAFKGSPGEDAFLKEVRRIKPRVAVSVWADARVHRLMARSGAKQRVGFSMSKENYYGSHLEWRAREIMLGKALGTAAAIANFGPLLTVSLERRHPQQHHLMCWEQLAQVLLLAPNVTAPWVRPALEIIPSEIEHALGEARAAGQPIWMAYAGAPSEEQNWPIENFDRVLREELQATGACVILLDSPDHAWSGELKHTFISYQPSSLRALFAVLDEADAVLCNDGVAGHVAAALGKPAVTVFSSNSPEWFAPWGSLPRAVRRDVCQFYPCMGRCQQTSYICRDAVTVEMVGKPVRQLQSELRSQT